MLSQKRIQTEARTKYTKRLNTLLKKKNPNLIEISFLRGVIQRIDEGKLFT